MSGWGEWIIQVVAYGVICFLLKRELNQMDQRHKNLSDKIEQTQKNLSEEIEKTQKGTQQVRAELMGTIEQVQKEARAANHEVKDELARFIAELPFKYTLRDDFIRTIASMENKLDKILDQVTRGGHSE